MQTPERKEFNDVYDRLLQSFFAHNVQKSDSSVQKSFEVIHEEATQMLDSFIESFMREYTYLSKYSNVVVWSPASFTLSKSGECYMEDKNKDHTFRVKGTGRWSSRRLTRVRAKNIIKDHTLFVDIQLTPTIPVKTIEFLLISK